MIHGTGKQVGVSYAEEEGHEQQYSGKAWSLRRSLQESAAAGNRNRATSLGMMYLQ
jgi:hypothetical protein